MQSIDYTLEKQNLVIKHENATNQQGKIVNILRTGKMYVSNVKKEKSQTKKNNGVTTNL